MIINTSIFKKLIKEAYTGGGLNIQHTGEDIYIWGGSWGIKTTDKFLTNKEKAAVIELAGDIPKEGIIRVHNKEELNTPDHNPLETYMNSDPWDKFYYSKVKVEEETPLRHESQLFVNDTGKIEAVTERLAQLVDASAKTGDDLEIEGPYQVDGCPWLMLWRNNTTTVAVAVRSWQGDELLLELKKELEQLVELKGLEVLAQM